MLRHVALVRTEIYEVHRLVGSGFFIYIYQISKVDGVEVEREHEVD
jgi:hypothetical protein